MVLQNGVFYSVGVARRRHRSFVCNTVTSLPFLSLFRREALKLTPNATRVGAEVRSVLKPKSAIVAGYLITLSIIET